MPRRQILTERSRTALFDLPTDAPSLLRHYTLADDDIEHMFPASTQCAGPSVEP